MDITIIKERERVFNRLWARMDFDARLITNHRFVLRDYKAKGFQEIPEAYSVTRPLAQNDYNKFTNKLIALKRKIKILTDDIGARDNR